jgi:D-serine deaminase-like pyridoxal phosphate-dependent protein
MPPDRNYAYYRDIFKQTPMPFAFVDLDLFDENVQAILRRAGDKPVCVASKSVRCVALLRRILDASPRFHSIMAYSVREAVFLARNGFDNILVAYPVLGQAAPSGLCKELRAGRRITLMVDSPAHVAHLNALGAVQNVIIPLCIDVDMSMRYPGLYFGVHRSGIQTPEQALALWRCIQQHPHVRLDGMMGYEAQVAGVQDHAPGATSQNLLLRLLKPRAVRDVAARRAAVVRALHEAGAELRFVNGGGTGSIETTILEDPVTEVTAGSGFYSPALFDHYTRFRHHPAAAFALEITRRPEAHIYTCHGGGYIASGAAGTDRLPLPYLPEGARLFPREAAGEVQTPVQYDGPEKMELGDPIFFRHAKAGELCERFNSLTLIADGRITSDTPTYRGEGCCFL